MIKHALALLGLLTMLNQSNALEWDSSRFSIGGGIGYADINASYFSASPWYLINAGMNIPILVEQHLRLSPTVQFNFIPTEANIKHKHRGGNYLSAAVAAFIEHDFPFFQQKGWLGIGPQLSARWIHNYYQWNQTGPNTFLSEKQDTSLALTGELTARVILPIVPSIDTAITTQVSPFDTSFNAFSLQLLYQF